MAHKQKMVFIFNYTHPAICTYSIFPRYILMSASLHIKGMC